MWYQSSYLSSMRYACVVLTVWLAGCRVLVDHWQRGGEGGRVQLAPHHTAWHGGARPRRRSEPVSLSQLPFQRRFVEGLY